MKRLICRIRHHWDVLYGPQWLPVTAVRLCRRCGRAEGRGGGGWEYIPHSA